VSCAVPPTEESWVGSPYGYRPGRTTGERRFHPGLDFRAARGEPVYNAAPGTVETIVHDDGQADSVLPEVQHRGRAFRGYGNVVVVKHLDGSWASYNHLEEIKVVPGETLPEGAVLGTVGASTNGKFRGMGPHLHFEIRRARPDGGSPFPGPHSLTVDPVRWFAALGVDRDGRLLVPDGEPCDLTALARELVGATFAEVGPVGPQGPDLVTLAGALGAPLPEPPPAPLPWDKVAEGQPSPPPGYDYVPPEDTYPKKVREKRPLGYIALGLGAAVLVWGWWGRSGGLGGFVERHRGRWCVHNEATGRVIVAGGQRRCHGRKADAEDVLAVLDCRYTGRRCARARVARRRP